MYRGKNRTILADRNTAFLVPILLLFSLSVLGVFSLLIFTDDSANPFQSMYLMPWVLLTGIVIAAPSAYLYYKKRFNLFHPLTFAAWSYFIPAFFFGGLILASGLSNPYFLTFVEDERYNMPLTLVYVMLGYLGLTAGFFLPYGRMAGDKIYGWLPDWNWKSNQLIIPGLILLLLGLANTVMAFALGLLGFQRVEEIGAYDGLLFLLTLFWLEASCLLWLCVFRARRLTVNYALVIGVVLAAAVTKAAFQGNRGSLLQVFILVAFAFVMSGREIKFQHRAFGAILLTLAIIIGMIYGTTFRSIKRTEEQVGIDEYAEYVGKTIDKVSEQDLAVTLETGFLSLAERLEAVSSLAVVVSNYEKLKPYEESYGLDNNIWKDSITFFIPRPLWKDKPVASEPHKYGDLYFNYSENSFTITPMGDLLRNFGPVGVPLGMLFLGFWIRIIYAALIEDKEFSYWRTTLFYMILTSISYESFYGSIIPYVMRAGFISVVGILIVWFLMGNARRKT